jgi:hypothetical protein
MTSIFDSALEAVSTAKDTIQKKINVVIKDCTRSITGSKMPENYVGGSKEDLDEFYNNDADKKLLNSYTNKFTIKGLTKEYLGDKRDEIAESLVKQATNEVGLLIGQAVSVNAGANFIVYGKQFVGTLFQAISVLETVYDAYLNPKFIPLAGDVFWDRYHKLNDEIAKINAIIKAKLSDFKQLENAADRANAAKSIREMILIRNRVESAKDIYRKWLEANKL